VRATAGVLAALVLLIPAGCAQPGAGGSAADAQPLDKPEVLGVKAGLPTGISAHGRARPVAAILGPGEVALVTWGSSSCPYTPVRLRVTGSDSLRVALDLPGSRRTVCTADLGPSTIRLGLDPAMTSDGNVSLVLDFRHRRGDVRVTARPLSEG